MTTINAINVSWFEIFYSRQSSNLINRGASTQWAFTCSKLTIETLEQGVKYVQS